MDGKSGSVGRQLGGVVEPLQALDVCSLAYRLEVLRVGRAGRIAYNKLVGR